MSAFPASHKTEPSAVVVLRDPATITCLADQLAVLMPAWRIVNDGASELRELQGTADTIRAQIAAVEDSIMRTNPVSAREAAIVAILLAHRVGALEDAADLTPVALARFLANSAGTTAEALAEEFMPGCRHAFQLRTDH